MPEDAGKADIARINRSLLDAYPVDFKSDAFAGYLYMKFQYYFAYMLLKTLGSEVEEPEPKPDETSREMLQMLVDQVISRGVSKDTGIMHGKVLLKDDALKLVSQTEDMHIVPSERVIPYRIAREVILENPTAIAAGRCMCRSVSPNPCIPPSEQQICMFIGEPNVSFVVAHNPSYRRITQKDAARILEETHKAGVIHCAYLEVPTSSRFCSLCSCCSCCCLGPKMLSLYDSNENPFLAPSGYVPEVSDKCNGCGECVDACAFNAVSVDEQTQRAVVDITKCMGCAVCEDKCPADAITLRLEPSHGDPMDIEAMKLEAT